MTDFMRKLTQLDQALQLPALHVQVLDVRRVMQAVDQKIVLNRAPRPLGGIQPAQRLTPVQQAKLKVAQQLLNSLRQYLSIQYGIWSLPNLAAAQAIKQHFNPTNVLEVMAGNAYWSKAFDAIGLKTIATDSLEWAKTSKTGSQPFFPVQDLSALAAVKSYPMADLVFCSWSPNFGHADIDLIKAVRRDTDHAQLLFVGDRSGVTNTTMFWQQAELVDLSALWDINTQFISYDFIDEEILQVKR